MSNVVFFFCWNWEQTNAIYHIFSLAHYRHPSVLYSSNAKYATISSAIEAIPASTFESIEYSGLFVKVSNEIYQVYFNTGVLVFSTEWFLLTLECLIGAHANWFFNFFSIRDILISIPPPGNYWRKFPNQTNFLKYYTYADFFAILQKERPVFIVFCFVR